MQITKGRAISERESFAIGYDKRRSAPQWPRVSLWRFLLLLVALSSVSVLHARQSNDSPASPAATSEQQLGALQLEMTNAWSRVLQIVNRPVTAYARTADMSVSVYSPGWFHPGAMKPDFNTVDIRKSQDLNYAQRTYVSSDISPGVCFLGKDLEFNSMTKYFYTNRSVPKRKLTETEMLEINQLYRTIGRCEGEIARLQNPAGAETQSTNAADETEQVVPGQSFEAIRKIPKEKRAFYGGIAIGALVVFVVVSRLFKKRAG